MAFLPYIIVALVFTGFAFISLSAINDKLYAKIDKYFGVNKLRIVTFSLVVIEFMLSEWGAIKDARANGGYLVNEPFHFFHKIMFLVILLYPVVLIHLQINKGIILAYRIAIIAAIVLIFFYEMPLGNWENPAMTAILALMTYYTFIRKKKEEANLEEV